MKRMFFFLALAVFASAGAFADSFSGNFAMDDDVKLIPFSVVSSSLVTMETTSFGDGSKGFEPVLTLYDGSGNLFLQDSTGGTAPGGCGARSIDPVSGFCLDAFIQALLGPGSYTLALTEADNVPNGPTLADGFPQAGNGNFTGPEFLGQPGSFILFDGSQRNSDWALQINSRGLAPVPEPGTAALLLSGVIGLRFKRWKVSRNK